MVRLLIFTVLLGVVTMLVVFNTDEQPYRQSKTNWSLRFQVSASYV